MTIKQLLEKKLPAIIEKGYQQACYYFKIISNRKPLFKGFFSPEVYQEILANEEILTNLKIDALQKKHFAKALPKVELTKTGIALPTSQESWIILNPFYHLVKKYSAKLVVELVETIAHEVAHAVLFNVDIWRGHDFPHSEITKYLQDYYLNNYNWEKILK
jgi:hypothetical protein